MAVLGAGQPAASVGQSESQPANAAARFVSTPQIQLDYATTNETPVAAVDVWVSTDSGRSWRAAEVARAGAHTVRYTAPADGKYGFYLVLHSAAGDSAAPPQAGTPPLLSVIVDTTPPLLQVFDVLKDAGPGPDPRRSRTHVRIDIRGGGDDARTRGDAPRFFASQRAGFDRHRRGTTRRDLSSRDIDRRKPRRIRRAGFFTARVRPHGPTAAPRRFWPITSRGRRRHGCSSPMRRAGRWTSAWVADRPCGQSHLRRRRRYSADAAAGAEARRRCAPAHQRAGARRRRGTRRVKRDQSAGHAARWTARRSKDRRQRRGRLGAFRRGPGAHPPPARPGQSLRATPVSFPWRAARLEDAVPLAPHDPDLLSDLGGALYRTGRYAEANSRYSAALQALPRSRRGARRPGSGRRHAGTLPSGARAPAATGAGAKQRRRRMAAPGRCGAAPRKYGGCAGGLATRLGLRGVRPRRTREGPAPARALREPRDRPQETPLPRLRPPPARRIRRTRTDRMARCRRRTR